MKISHLLGATASPRSYCQHRRRFARIRNRCRRQAKQKPQDEEIIVTGSRISHPLATIDAAVPVTGDHRDQLLGTRGDVSSATP